MLQRTEPFDMAAIRAVQDWLYHHPEDAASEISVSGLGKYDGPLAEVIGLIGPPVATPCIPALVGLLLDMNWPAYPCARDALFSFDVDSLLAGLQTAVEHGELEGFDCFCCEVLQCRPAWLSRLRPVAERVLQARTDSGVDLPYTLDLQIRHDG
jgi:hypothetical protein